MIEVRAADDLWRTSLMPEGLVVRWRVADGARVRQGEPLAELRVEDALHEVIAPASGRLTIALKADGWVEPGALLGSIR